MISRLRATIFQMDAIAEAAVASKTDRRSDRCKAQITPLIKIQASSQNQKLYSQDHSTDKEIKQFHCIFRSIHQNPGNKEQLSTVHTGQKSGTSRGRNCSVSPSSIRIRKNTDAIRLSMNCFIISPHLYLIVCHFPISFIQSEHNFFKFCSDFNCTL